MSVIKGIDDVTLTAEPKRFSRGDGETAEEIWEGPRLKAIDKYDSAKEDTTIDEVSIDPDGAFARVRLVKIDPDITVSEDENTVWELSGNDLFRDIRTHPYFTTASGSVLPEIARTDYFIDNGEEYDDSGFIWPDITSRYYALRMHGVEGYYTSSLVLKRTLKVSARTDITLAYTGVNYVQSLDSINPPNALLGALDSLPIISGYNDYADPSDPTITYGNWEWLKKSPQLKSLASGKQYEMVQEWWGAEQWSTVFYLGTWDPVAP